MQNAKFTNVLYFISIVILVTLCIQFYWNYKNYKTGEKQLIREVGNSVNKAIDSYFMHMEERNTFKFFTTEDGQILRNSKVDSLIEKLGGSGENKNLGLDILNNLDLNQIADMNVITGTELRDLDSIPRISKDNGISENPAKLVILSFKTDTLEIPILNTYIDKNLKSLDINVKYAYIFQGPTGITQSYNKNIINGNEVGKTTINSPYLPKDSTFELHYENLAPTVIRRNSIGIILSGTLIAIVIGCLFFLLKIINRQKQLAELKNDLIGNITHEFKTPIATAKVALEGIEKFNKDNDPVKTLNYLQVSNAQLDKLQLMVEKLLETATIDGNNLQFKKEKVHLELMLSDLIEKHQNLAPTNQFTFYTKDNETSVIADAFHLENALNNILDNAVKYGGDKIEVSVSSINEVVKIGISDNGGNLTKHQAEQLFDKFYRVPKGNTHDVKGFGIGLYYSKNIIEKHGGSIELLLNNQTNFIITIPVNG
ncbi:HAMP domain-containing histidine kinase [Salegentibacter sp. LM13S]|uniref:sensor histidine kinase n=1 Tax=Salegentibacter lacus TaxID=2873599 RepID=UPI001CCE39B9|nr:HAMP domain-containing sensor histidine kinase [Salegentibacter lacus]MBZ9629728.1 HAMP domain-containing histidine kinase [Salegentibacter lacus]